MVLFVVAYLGIDYGRARIGLALSETGQIARPIGYIKNKGIVKSSASVNDLYTKHNIRCIMCGIPYNIDGTESDMSREARKFGEYLRDTIKGVKVVYHDERYSSIDAEQYIREKMGITKMEKIKELVDGVAAAVVLQSYLDTMEEK